MEKKQYISPLTEVITNDYLCDGETIKWSQEAEDAGARGTDFMEDESEDNGTVTTSGTENSRCMGSAPPCGFPAP